MTFVTSFKRKYMKRIFIIDWVLIGVFILSACSGFGLHIAGHGNSHETWHNWAVFHIIGSTLFFATILLHLVTHKGWYKGILKNGIGRKSKVTVVLSIIFLFLSATGFALLGMSGADSSLGLWHYKTGIITTLMVIGHTIKRLPVLRKSLDTKKAIKR